MNYTIPAISMNVNIKPSALKKLSIAHTSEERLPIFSKPPTANTTHAQILTHLHTHRLTYVCTRYTLICYTISHLSGNIMKEFVLTANVRENAWKMDIRPNGPNIYNGMLFH